MGELGHVPQRVAGLEFDRAAVGELHDERAVEHHHEVLALVFEPVTDGLIGGDVERVRLDHVPGCARDEP